MAYRLFMDMELMGYLQITSALGTLKNDACPQ